MSFVTGYSLFVGSLNPEAWGLNPFLSLARFARARRVRRDKESFSVIGGHVTNFLSIYRNRKAGRTGKLVKVNGIQNIQNWCARCRWTKHGACSGEPGGGGYARGSSR